MGLFGGNKKKNASDTEQIERRTTRRAVVPGAKSPGKPDSQGKVAIRTGPARKPSEGKIPKAEAGEPLASPPQAAIDSGMIGSRPAPAPTGGLLSDSERPARGPIQAGQSQPPDFTGSLAAAKASGVCRTGDAALSEFLISKAKLLNAEQVAQAKQKSQDDDLPLDAAAVQLGLLSEDQLVNALTQECWVPHLKVDKYEIRKKALDTISCEDAAHYGVFPVDKLGSLLTLAMINPLDAETIRALEAKTGLDIKKVVATRSEIVQGIEKYYSGKVQAKDGSISFTQDIEPKSVTAMLSKVNTTTAPPPPRPAPLPTPAPAAPSDSIIPEIQDIDDLLAGDEVIAPAIIEPLSVRVAANAAPMVMEGVEPEPLVTPPPVRSTPLPANDVPAPEFQLGDLPSVTTDTVLAPKSQAKPIPPVNPLDLAIDMTPPAGAKVPAATPAIRTPVPPVRTPTPAAQSVPSSSFTPSSASPVVGARAGGPPKTATSRFAAPARAVDTAGGVITLTPVLEDEFQHAITHGKARTFEKWVGLQTRNRIVNAVPVEAEFDGLLAGLYAAKSA